jgi:hypothetical protein
VLRRLQQVTGEMLGQAEGERRAQLESLHAQLGEAIDETGATGSERASLLW